MSHDLHNHGSEYQLKILHEGGTELLSGWMSSEEEVVEAVAAIQWVQGKTYWLQERNILCPACSHMAHRILEYPLTKNTSARYSTHDSRVFTSRDSILGR
jgi:hypothetical protein